MTSVFCEIYLEARERTLINCTGCINERNDKDLRCCIKNEPGIKVTETTHQLVRLYQYDESGGLLNTIRLNIHGLAPHFLIKAAEFFEVHLSAALLFSPQFVTGNWLLTRFVTGTRHCETHLIYCSSAKPFDKTTENNQVQNSEHPSCTNHKSSETTLKPAEHCEEKTEDKLYTDYKKSIDQDQSHSLFDRSFENKFVAKSESAVCKSVEVGGKSVEINSGSSKVGIGKSRLCRWSCDKVVPMPKRSGASTSSSSAASLSSNQHKVNSTSNQSIIQHQQQPQGHSKANATSTCKSQPSSATHSKKIKTEHKTGWSRSSLFHYNCFVISWSIQYILECVMIVYTNSALYKDGLATKSRPI